MRPGVPEGEADGDHRIAERAGWWQSVGVGASQAIALIPGFSRSGATMGGGLLVGLSNEDAARFAFLLATPIIGAAAVLKIPVLLGSDGNGVRGPAVAASLCSAVTAYLSVRFLMRYFETNRLTPFAVVLLRRGHRALDLVRGQLSGRYACTSGWAVPSRFGPLWNQAKAKQARPTRNDATPCLTCTAETPLSCPRKFGSGSDLGGTVQYMIATAMKKMPARMPPMTSSALFAHGPSIPSIGQIGPGVGVGRYCGKLSRAVR